MKKWQEHKQKLDVKKLKELKAKGKVAAEHAAKKEKVYKSPKAKAERAHKKKLEKHSKEIRAKVKVKYEKEIKSWSREQGGVNANGDSGLIQVKQKAKKQINAEREMADISKKYTNEKRAKHAMNSHSNSPACKRLSGLEYKTCSVITQEAYMQCEKILKKASEQYRVHEQARRMLKDMGHKARGMKTMMHHHFKKAGGKKAGGKKAGGKKAGGKKAGGTKGEKKGEKKKVKKVVKKLKKVMKSMVGQVVQSKKVKADAKKVKHLKKQASKDLRRATTLSNAGDYADATAYAKAAVRTSDEVVSASDTEATDAVGEVKKKTLEASESSLYQQQVKFYNDNLTPQSLYEMQSEDYLQDLVAIDRV